MDIGLSETNSGTFLKPKSVHGILWLQTHFESTHWESIAKGLVIISIQDAQNLYKDAMIAGLNINFINALTQIDKN
tara:strand:- start:475 stop:702 length:228 start_codon:yes stop_codon:yes gene_type:complete